MSNMSPDRNKMLCIEDDVEAAALLAEEFTERGYDMTLAHDGQKGFTAILETMPDVVSAR
jgi:DNA-binding response OmpR family regulator